MEKRLTRALARLNWAKIIGDGVRAFLVLVLGLVVHFLDLLPDVFLGEYLVFEGTLLGLLVYGSDLPECLVVLEITGVFHQEIDRQVGQGTAIGLDPFLAPGLAPGVRGFFGGESAYFTHLDIAVHELGMDTGIGLLFENLDDIALHNRVAEHLERPLFSVLGDALAAFPLERQILAVANQIQIFQPIFPWLLAHVVYVTLLASTAIHDTFDQTLGPTNRMVDVDHPALAALDGHLLQKSGGLGAHIELDSSDRAAFPYQWRWTEFSVVVLLDGLQHVLVEPGPIDGDKFFRARDLVLVRPTEKNELPTIIVALILLKIVIITEHANRGLRGGGAHVTNFEIVRAVRER